jgi:glutaminyl-tRNA synthetase
MKKSDTKASKSSKPASTKTAVEFAPPSNFIKHIIDADIKAAKNDGRVHTRFPPEPNGYLHIGHAKSICLNFGLAEEYSGLCNLRYDDTDPAKEEVEYVESIKQDVRWLGFDWEDREYNQGIPGYPDRARQKQSLSRAFNWRKSGSV